MKTLIVDDDASSAVLLKGYLLPYGECVTAADGKEAMDRIYRAFAEDSFCDLICLDISMPKMDGHAVLSEVRRIEDKKGLPSSDRAKVIMASAAPKKKNVLQAFNAQCDAYLPKPVNKNDVFKEIYLLGLVDADSLLKKLLNIE